jgi:uncharacterized protein (DUF305 family)
VTVRVDDPRTEVPAPAAPALTRGPARWQVVLLVVALCFVAGVVGYWIGNPADDDDSFNSVDVGFLADMSAHHSSAIAMSFELMGRGDDSVVEHFARDITLTQAQEIAVMNALLSESGDRTTASDDLAMDWMGAAVPVAEMPGLPTRAEAVELAAAEGATADDVFTRLMIRHHAAGTAMAAYAAEHGKSARVRNLGRAMSEVQEREIAEMNARRAVLGLPRVDASELEELGADHGH